MKKRNKSGDAGITEAAKETKASKPKKKRKKAPIIIAVLVVAFIVIRMVACSSGGEAGAIVTTTNALRGDLQESISTNGTVKSEEVKIIFAPVTGTLDTVYVAAGDAVQAGELLVSYDLERLESSMRQSQLQFEKSNANYNSTMADNAQNQARLNEARVNLDVLNQQIEDTKAYIRELQNELSESQRHTNNALAEEGMHLNNSLRDRTEELKTLEGELAGLEAQLKGLQADTAPSGADTFGTPDAAAPDGAVLPDGITAPMTPDTSDSDQIAALQQQIADKKTEITQKEAEISEINSSIARNGYVSSTANNSDYVAELQQKISDAQEQLQQYETYKAEMQGQKSSTENAVMDSYDRTAANADKEMASLTYQESEEDYNQAKAGICAEFTGIITECSAVPGSGVNSGVQLMTLESSENVKVIFSASKYDLEKLEIGQRVDVTISGNVYEGEISKINRMAESNASNTPMVGVEVHLLAPDDKVILGMDAKLFIYTKKAENAVMVPVEAINADKEGDFLFVVENGVAVKRPVVCGISTDEFTEILEGITEEDVIILTSYTNLEEGMPVTVMPTQ